MRSPPSCLSASTSTPWPLSRSAVIRQPGPQRHGGACGGFLAQHAFDEDLRHAVRQFGRAPRAGQRLDHFARSARRRQAEARQLMPGVAGEIGNVGRIVRRQSLGAHLLGKAQPPVVLHGARLGGVGGGKLRRRGALLQQDRRNAAAAKLDGEREPARAAANDDDVAVLLLAHAIPRLHCCGAIIAGRTREIRLEGMTP